MFSSYIQRASSSMSKVGARKALEQQTHRQLAQYLSTSGGVSPEEMPFHHFRVGSGDSGKSYKKFISPRKRANKIMADITEAAKEKGHNPHVHDVPFRVGDAIEMTMVSQGGVNSTATEKIRGVVLGMDRRGLGTGVYLRDVVFGEPIDRKVPLYSPLLKSITVLEENFVFKKKRKVKRAKLYYLRDRLPQETRVTKY